jgi:hypothetical protein
MRPIAWQLPILRVDAGNAARCRERGDLEFVLTTLLAYDGADFIHPLCMDGVGQLDDGDDLLGRVSQVLRETGVRLATLAWCRPRRSGTRGSGTGWLIPEKVKPFGRSELRRIGRSIAWKHRRRSATWSRGSGRGAVPRRSRTRSLRPLAIAHDGGLSQSKRRAAVGIVAAGAEWPDCAQITRWTARRRCRILGSASSRTLLTPASQHSGR